MLAFRSEFGIQCSIQNLTHPFYCRMLNCWMKCFVNKEKEILNFYTFKSKILPLTFCSEDQHDTRNSEHTCTMCTLTTYELMRKICSFFPHPFKGNRFDSRRRKCYGSFKTRKITLTFWSHIGRKTFCKTACLTLIPSWYINYAFSAFFACILQISTENETSKKKWRPKRTFFFSKNFQLVRIVRFTKLLKYFYKIHTVECCVWKIHDNRHMMEHHNVYQMLGRHILYNGYLHYDANQLFEIWALT